MATYYARSIINGKEILAETETILAEDHISITVFDSDNETTQKKIQNLDLIKIALFDKEINYQLIAAGVKTPIRKAIIKSHEKTSEDHWTFKIELK